MATSLFSSTSRKALRTSIQFSGRQSKNSIRQFSISGQEAIKLIEENVPEVKVGESFLRSLTKVNQSNSGKKEAPVKAIKVLLHADRRGKALPPFRSTDPIQSHFGPALIGCHGSYLEKIEENSQLGKGDLGILQLQRDFPSRTVDLPISIKDGLKLDKAFGFLLRMAPIAGMSVAEPVQWKAAEILQKVWSIFDKFEGVWFTFELAFDDQKNQISINQPFLEFDDFGVKRVPELKQLYESRPRDENTAKAEDGGLFYIKLPKEGNVGSFGYGAGNAMATMDGLSLVGGKPANFLDGGGGANKQNARLAIETLNRDESVKAIFVNTFGGITQTDVVAEGIIEAVKENQIRKPIVARILGTGAERAKELLSSSDIDFTIQDDFKQAARSAVDRANG